MGKTTKAKAAEPLLEIDGAARKLFRPYRKTAPVKGLRWFGQGGDQLQLRLLAGGMIAVGALRRNPRLARAGVRMLISHELATLTKNAVKHRVDRWRPHSADTVEDVKPRKGRNRSKAVTSFPSGHSAGAMAVACAFAAEYPEHRTPALAAASAVCLAQVPTCSHYPSDVAAGATIGVATDAAVGVFWRAAKRAWRQWMS